MNTLFSPSFLFDSGYSIDKLAAELAILEGRIQFLKENRQVAFAGSLLALIGALFSTHLYVLRHPEDDPLKLLFTLHAGLNIAIFCYVLQNYNKKIENLEQLKETMEMHRTAMEESLFDYAESIRGLRLA